MSKSDLPRRSLFSASPVVTQSVELPKKEAKVPENTGLHQSWEEIATDLLKNCAVDEILSSTAALFHAYVPRQAK